MQNGSDAAIYRNIRVFDGCGNELQPTYRKRAKSLVKHGRAQWCGVEQDSIVLTDTTSIPQTERTADYYITEDTQMSEYRENENIVKENTNEVNEASKAANEVKKIPDHWILASEAEKDLAHQNIEIKKAAVQTLAKMQVEIVSGLNDNGGKGNVGNWYNGLYQINVNALKDLVQDNKPEKAAEPSVEKAVFDMKMRFIESAMEKLDVWSDQQMIDYDEYFEKSKELMDMLDEIAAEVKTAETAE